MSSCDVFAFDAYGTLFDVHSAVSRAARHLGHVGPSLSDLWRQRQLEYAWVRTLADRHRDFEAITEDALIFAMRCFDIDDLDLQKQLMHAYRELTPYPDVHDALRCLRSQGKRVVIFSNGTADMIDHAVHSAGLDNLVDARISTERARAFKTRKDVYELVCSDLFVKPRQVSFQSSNRWDIAGATAFGFRTVWVNRNNHPDEYVDLCPDAEITTLRELCTARQVGQAPSAER